MGICTTSRQLNRTFASVAKQSSRENILSYAVPGGVISGKPRAWYTVEDNFSRLLGGKSTRDTDDWAPDMDAVRAVIHFTLATRPFEHDSNERVLVTR